MLAVVVRRRTLDRQAIDRARDDLGLQTFDMVIRTGDDERGVAKTIGRIEKLGLNILPDHVVSGKVECHLVIEQVCLDSGFPVGQCVRFVRQRSCPLVLAGIGWVFQHFGCGTVEAAWTKALAESGVGQRVWCWFPGQRRLALESVISDMLVFAVDADVTVSVGSTGNDIDAVARIGFILRADLVFLVVVIARTARQR